MSRTQKITPRPAKKPSPKAPAKPEIRTVFGEPSWQLKSKDVEAFLTQTAGHLGPVTFRVGGKKIAPFSAAWSKVKPDAKLPPILRVLRGDFFCMPFGGNTVAFGKERHPIHGESANAKWTLSHFLNSRDGVELHADLSLKVRRGRLQKQISLITGHPAIYQRHIISGMSGEMNLGHHAMVKFPDVPGSGVLSTSRFVYGQNWIEPTERPESKGYSALKPGATFTSLDKSETVFGDTTDLSHFPARRGYEDIAMIIADDSLPFAWTAVTFAKQGYIWFALKDPRVLRSTVMWFSNGGRHAAPWNGDHVNVMGLEEVTSFFAAGLSQSAADNHITKMGYPTTLPLDPAKPTVVNYIMAVAPAPTGFDRVSKIEASDDGVRLTSSNGTSLNVPLDVSFLTGGA